MYAIAFASAPSVASHIWLGSHFPPFFFQHLDRCFVCHGKVSLYQQTAAIPIQHFLRYADTCNHPICHCGTAQDESVGRLGTYDSFPKTGQMTTFREWTVAFCKFHTEFLTIWPVSESDSILPLFSSNWSAYILALIQNYIWNCNCKKFNLLQITD